MCVKLNRARKLKRAAIALRGGDEVAGDSGLSILHHRAALPAASALQFIAFDIAIVGVDEHERGARAVSRSALDGLDRDVIRLLVVDGDGRAVQRVRGADFDRVQVRQRHSAVRTRHQRVRV